MSESEKQLRKLNDKIHKAIQNNLNEYLVLLQNVIGTKAGDIILYDGINVGTAFMNWDTGNLSRSVQQVGQIDKENLRITVGSNLEYAPYIEYGVPPYTKQGKDGNTYTHPGIPAYQPFFKGMTLAWENIISKKVEETIEKTLDENIDDFINTMFD